MKNSPLFIIIGPSGAGKTRLIEGAARHLDLSVGTLYTDRPPLFVKEKGLRFISSDAFDTLSDCLSFIGAGGCRYAVPLSEAEETDVYITDTAGAAAFRERFSAARQVVVIGITAPSDICRERLSRRACSSDYIDTLLKEDVIEYADMASVCDKVYINAEGIQPLLRRIENYILQALHGMDDTVTRQAYDAFCTEWLLSHGVMTSDILGLISGLVSEVYGENISDSVLDFFKLALSRQSFRDERLPSYDDFIASDYKDPEYRDKLLTRMELKYHLPTLSIYRPSHPIENKTETAADPRRTLFSLGPLPKVHTGPLPEH